MIFPYKPWTLKETLTVGLFIRPDRGKLWEFRYPDGSVAYSFDIGHYENRIAELEFALTKIQTVHRKRQCEPGDENYSEGDNVHECMEDGAEWPCETVALVTAVVHNAKESGDFRKEGS